MPPSTSSQQTSAMLAVVWTKNRELLLHRLDTIEPFCRQLPGSASDQALRAEASADAHKLAGSLGMFGLAEGTLVARDLEHRLNSSTAEELLQANISGLTAHLRKLIETYEIKVSVPGDARRRKVLIVDHEPASARDISTVAEKRGMQAAIANDLTAARSALVGSMARFGGTAD